MKAEINGIKLEGTPQEIHEFLKLKSKEAAKKPVTDWEKLIKIPFDHHPNTPYPKVMLNPNGIIETYI